MAAPRRHARRDAVPRVISAPRRGMSRLPRVLQGGGRGAGQVVSGASGDGQAARAPRGRGVLFRTREEAEGNLPLTRKGGCLQGGFSVAFSTAIRRIRAAVTA